MIHPDGYTIRPARPDELGALPAVERAAAAQFRTTAYPTMADAPLASEAAGGPHDRVWVAVAADGRPAGFAIVRPLDDGAYVHELDVAPAHARRGLGRRLLEAVAAWAAGRGLRSLTLSTFRDVPWNAPYYARLGFRALGDDELGEGLRALRRAEAEGGLPVGERVCMRFDLAKCGDAREGRAP